MIFIPSRFLFLSNLEIYFEFTCLVLRVWGELSFGLEGIFAIFALSLK